MPRPLRTQAAGASYHIGAPGNDKTEAFISDEDRSRLLALPGDVVGVYGWHLYAYCFNRRHDRTGHLFERRYWAALVESDAHMLALIPDIAANPVRASMRAWSR